MLHSSFSIHHFLRQLLIWLRWPPCRADGRGMESRFHNEFPFNKRTSRPAPEPERPSEPAAPEPAPTTVPPQERRRAPRQTLVAKATIRPDGSVSMPPLMTTGFVSNISMGGIGLHTRRPL